MPTGGVSVPMDMFTADTTPKCTGPILTCVMIGLMMGWFGLQPVRQVFRVYFNISQDLAQEPWADILPFAHGDGGPPAVGVLELPVAAFRLPEQSEAHSLECPDQLPGLDDGISWRSHAAISTRLIPMISGCGGIRSPRSFIPARHSAITSLMLAMTASYDLPCV